MISKKLKITKSKIINLLDNFDSKLRIPLKEDPLTALYPEQIIEQIENRTEVGKKYVLQISKILIENKKNVRKK